MRAYIISQPTEVLEQLEYYVENFIFVVLPEQWFACLLQYGFYQSHLSISNQTLVSVIYEHASPHTARRTDMQSKPIFALLCPKSHEYSLLLLRALFWRKKPEVIAEKKNILNQYCQALGEEISINKKRTSGRSAGFVFFSLMQIIF